MKEHDSCHDCYYQKLSSKKEPCCRCKGTVLHSDPEYKTRPDLWTDEQKDFVNHPKHYNREGAMECWDEEIMIFGEEAFMNHLLCSAWEYRYRASDKNGIEDLKKSDMLMNKYAELLHKIRKEEK